MSTVTAKASRASRDFPPYSTSRAPARGGLSSRNNAADSASMSAVSPNETAADSASPPISDEQRNGTISAIAIVLGFSLTFTGTWTQGDNPWSFQSLSVMVLATPGIVLQLQALFGLMRLPVVNLTEHRGITARFRLGICVVLFAYVINTILEAVKDLRM